MKSHERRNTTERRVGEKLLVDGEKEVLKRQQGRPEIQRSKLAHEKEPAVGRFERGSEGASPNLMRIENDSVRMRESGLCAANLLSNSIVVRSSSEALMWAYRLLSSRGR